MSDKKNIPKPDRAGDGLDDLDVPTYRPGQSASAASGKDESPAAESPTTSIYDRMGRAAPQSIPAKPKQKGSEAPVAATENETTSFKAAGGSAPLRSDAPTTAFSRPPKSEPAAAENPHTPSASSYRDTDFAPTNPGDTVTSSTQPTSESTPQTFDTTTTASGLYTGSTALSGDTADTPAETRDKAREGKRGTIDWGILLIRLLLGAYLVLTSVATFFQLGGDAGLAGLESDYADYVLPNILAILVPSLQLAAGVFLIFGLITPLFAAIATVVTAFTALHALSGSGAGLNVFAWDEPVMLSVILLGISLALQFTGPGLYSFDFSRRWARRPLASSWIFVVLGIAGAVALWWFGAGVNPLN